MKNGARGCLCEGAVMDMEILTELLQDYIKACKVLGKKPELKKKRQRQSWKDFHH